MAHKIFCLLTVFTVVFSFCACGGSDADTTVPETTAQSVETTAGEVITTLPETSSEEQTTAPAEETTAQTETTEPSTEAETTEPVTDAETTSAAVDVSAWDVGQIVEFYKNAAERTGNTVKSEQRVGLSDISVNNGQLGGVFSFVTPILSSFLSSSATVTDGITGEYTKLTPSDVSHARAYEGSRGTVVEITLNEQKDTGGTDNTDGSVAHGIYIVGDLLSIMSQLRDKGLPIDISMENTVITYSDPVIKAVVDSEGKIVNGTWSCTVEISLSDYKFAGSAVDSTVVVLNNTITVNGGFNS